MLRTVINLMMVMMMMMEMTVMVEMILVVVIEWIRVMERCNVYVVVFAVTAVFLLCISVVH